MPPPNLHQQAEALAKHLREHAEYLRDLSLTLVDELDRGTLLEAAADCELAAGMFQRVQAETREEGAQIAEAHLHVEPLDDLEPPADTVAKYSNTTCRMIAAAIRARQDRP